MFQEKSQYTNAVSRAVLDSAPDGILVINRDGLIVLANSQTEELLKYEPDELLGQHFEALLPELFREEHERLIAGCTRGPGLRPGRAGLQVRAVCRDGRDLPVDMSACTVEVDGGPLVCCVLRASTGGRRTAQGVRAAEEQFRMIVEKSQDILCIRSADGLMRYASPSIHPLLGYKQEEVVGTTCLEVIHPEDRIAVEIARDELLKNPGARDSVQFRALHANGSWVALEVVAYNLLDDPDIRGLVINGRDISERRQTEAEKEKLIKELREAAARANSLTGLLPICACCKKVKHAAGQWQQIETYIREHSQIEFSHGMCPECSRLWYPEYSKT